MSLALVALAGAGTAAHADPSAAPRLELGGFAGVFVPDDGHELYDPRVAEQVPLRGVVPELGLRVAFFPLRFLAVEGEVDLLPAKTRTGDRVLAYGARAHLLLELPARVTPFILGGFGTLGVRSDDDELGRDRDATGHVGAGIKLRLGGRVSLRLEGRLVRAPKVDVEGATTHLALLAGIGFSLGGGGAASRAAAAEVADAPVATPVASVVAPVAAPVAAIEPIEPIDLDRDDDGGDDDADRCPFEAGASSAQGCPDPDRDRDGVADPVDTCPDEAGTPAHHGCGAAPLAWLSQTRIVLGEPVTFATNRALLRARSLPVLDAVAAVLRVHPELQRVRIVGHTDDRGDRAHNRELSRRRAEAVRDYLSGRGIDAARLDADGQGEDRPVEPNSTAVGRAQNRRVEIERIGAGAGVGAADETP